MEGEWDTDGHAAPPTAPRVPGEPRVSECVCVCGCVCKIDTLHIPFD